MDEQKQVISYEDFERDWKSRHKGSIPRKQRISSWGLIGGILIWSIIAVGAALVSGAHSVPAILQTIPIIVPSPSRELLSLFGFTIFELLIFAGAVYRHESRFATWALVLAMLGALAANIGSSVVAVSENDGDALSLVVAIILAFIAPLAAFLAGEMIHRLYEKHAAKNAENNETYDAARKTLDAIINREFTKYEKAFMAVQPVHSVNSVNGSQPAPVHSVNSASGYSKQMNSRQIISEYFERHPEFRNMTLDQLNEAIEQESGVRVGRTSIHNVRKGWAVSSTNNGFVK